jgi:hypothetical protein
VADLRLPEETVLLITGEYHQLQAQLMDVSLINSQTTLELPSLPGGIKAFMADHLAPMLAGEKVLLKTEKIKPSFHSDAVNLEAQLGYRFLCTLKNQDHDTQVIEKLNA